MTATLLDELIARLRACDSGGDGRERPAAILWTDPDGSWRPLIEPALARMPELIVLGDYATVSRHGPAPWIRCVIDRTLPEPGIPLDRVPVVYLPNVSRQDLRAGEDCPPALQPIVELMYRGSLWLQANGSDWTVTAFMTSPKALGLDLAQDRGTIDALQRALREVALTPLVHFGKGRLEAEDFDRLLSGDVVRDMLRWMAEPAGAETRMGADRWTAFANLARGRFSLDPARDGPITAAERMTEGEGPWLEVWQRFEEAPTAYPGLVQTLRKAHPRQPLFADPNRWIEANDRAEEEIHRALRTLVDKRHQDACSLIVELEKKHAPRRKGVWSKLGLSPLANVLGPLARMAETARRPIGGSTPDDMAAAYRDRGWVADAAAWEALSASGTSDEALVSKSVRALMEPWLEESARGFQKALERQPLPGRGLQPSVAAAPGGCLLFADGLRYDLGVRLVDRLETRGCRLERRDRWAALPTVTATAKTAVSPVVGEVVAKELSSDFAPRLRSTGEPVQADNLRQAIRAAGYQVLDPSDLGMPLGGESMGWIECGQIDKRGHEMGAHLAGQIAGELDRLADKILSLLNAGWKSVRVVTDHGWLFLPGGLPKVDLPKHLTESRWARCAAMTGATRPEVCSTPWHWNEEVHVASAPGIACFNYSPEYAHGGLSLQECLVPDLLVERSGETKPAPAIRSITWRQMRCFIECSGDVKGVRADIRLGQAGGKSIVMAPKPLDHEGTVSLVVVDDDCESKDLILVLLDGEGNILAQQPTRVGAHS